MGRSDRATRPHRTSMDQTSFVSISLENVGYYFNLVEHEENLGAVMMCVG